MLQAKISGEIGDQTAVIRPKADRVPICVSGNSSPDAVIGRFKMNGYLGADSMSP